MRTNRSGKSRMSAAEWVREAAQERYLRKQQEREDRAEMMVGLGVLIVTLTLIVGAIVAGCTGHEGVAFMCIVALFLLFG